MKKKDLLEEMFSDSILNGNLEQKMKGGKLIATSERGSATRGTDSGGYLVLDDGVIHPDTVEDGTRVSG